MAVIYIEEINIISSSAVDPEPVKLHQLRLRAVTHKLIWVGNKEIIRILKGESPRSRGAWPGHTVDEEPDHVLATRVVHGVSRLYNTNNKEHVIHIKYLQYNKENIKTIQPLNSSLKKNSIYLNLSSIVHPLSCLPVYTLFWG